MKQKLKIAALSMCCFLLANTLSACGPKRVAEHLPIPEDRIDCVAIEGATGDPTKRPSMLPLLVPQWDRIVTIEDAMVFFNAYQSRVFEREKVATGYILRLEGALFFCANDAQWLREREAELKKREN